MVNRSSSIGQRLSEVLSQLKILKKISGDKEIAVLLKYKSASSISEIKNNKAAPTKELLDLLHKKFNVSTEYILEGKGTPFEKSVTIEDYESKTIAMIIKMDAKTDVIISALAEILAKQNGQLVETVSQQMIASVKSRIQDKTAGS